MERVRCQVRSPLDRWAFAQPAHCPPRSALAKPDATLRRLRSFILLALLLILWTVDSFAESIGWTGISGSSPSNLFVVGEYCANSHFYAKKWTTATTRCRVGVL